MPIDIVSPQEEFKARYKAAMHAIQSGIAMLMERGWEGTSPKHLRVGVNSAMVNDWVIAEFLIRKGIMTQVEYYALLAEGAEQEQHRLEEQLSEAFGTSVKLG